MKGVPVSEVPPPSPPARRLASPRWLDARLLVGVLLVVAGVAGGAKLFASADDSARVWVARHALAPGEHLTAADVRVGRARLYEHGDAYVSADRALPAGYVVTRPVSAGELLPYAALADSGGPTRTRLVTVPVRPGHLPPRLGPGDLVDVYVTASGAGRSADRTGPAQPRLVLERTAVQSADSAGGGLAGDSALAVVLSVPAERVGDVVAAVEGGSIDLVRVPPGQVDAPAADRSPALSAPPASPTPPAPAAPRSSPAATPTGRAGGR